MELLLVNFVFRGAQEAFGGGQNGKEDARGVVFVVGPHHELRLLRRGRDAVWRRG